MVLAILPKLLPVGICSISIYYFLKWYNKRRKSITDIPKKLYLKDNFFNGKFVLHLKGKTTFVESQNIKDGVETVLEYMAIAKERNKKFVIVWDGSDIKKGSFTEVLLKLDAQLDIESENTCDFVYAMSHTSPSSVYIPPKGLNELKNPIYNIIAGRGECTLDNILLENINTFHEKFSSFVVDEWNVINTVYYDDINIDDEENYISLLNVGIKECKIKHRENGHPYFTNNYGYLLLGIALVKLTNTKNIIYIDRSKVTESEYSLLSMSKKITQIRL